MFLKFGWSGCYERNDVIYYLFKISVECPGGKKGWVLLKRVLFCDLAVVSELGAVSSVASRALKRQEPCSSTGKLA